MRGVRCLLALISVKLSNSSATIFKRQNLLDSFVATAPVETLSEYARPIENMPGPFFGSGFDASWEVDFWHTTTGEIKSAAARGTQQVSLHLHLAQVMKQVLHARTARRRHWSTTGRSTAAGRARGRKGEQMARTTADNLSMHETVRAIDKNSFGRERLVCLENKTGSCPIPPLGDLHLRSVQQRPIAALGKGLPALRRCAALGGEAGYEFFQRAFASPPPWSRCESGSS